LSCFGVIPLFPEKLAYRIFGTFFRRQTEGSANFALIFSDETGIL
jgi:hypothetical protein